MNQAVNQTPVTVRDKKYFAQEAKIWLCLALAGCIFGLIAPGFNQWYLAWFGLTPLLFSTFSSKNPPQAFYRGVFFGYSYNLVYTIFILQFSAFVWPENLRPLTMVANTVVWLLFSMQQGALYGTFCFLARWVPLNMSVFPEKDEVKKILTWPALFVLPLLWVLIFNKLGNHLSSLAIPWSLIEYSQYKQTELIQIASLVGGIGISALLVMSNTVFAGLIATLAGKSSLNDLRFSGRLSLLTSVFLVQGIVTASLIYGNLHLQSTKCSEWTENKKEMVSVLQGNLLFGLNEIDPAKHWNRYLGLARSSPPGICVWPEWSIPVSISLYPHIFKELAAKAAVINQDWIVGAIDEDKKGNAYNAACVVGKSANGANVVYHKQYLVPFGEHSPAWLLNSPLGGLCGTLTPRRKGFTEGSESVVFTCGKNKVVPLICCELVSSELASAGVRKGGELLVDCSNTMWFQTKLLGDQSFAVCILRAVENHRYFVFGTSIGPSAFIDWHGRILKTAPMNEPCALSQEVHFDSRLTPFSRWFR